MRIAKVRSPRMSARCTPLIAESFGCTTRGQVVGDLVLVEVCEREAEVHGRELVVRASPAR
jgi:hypothetical protein